MQNREPLLRSDWTIHRSGAVFFEGTEDCQLLNCTLDQPGANAVFLNNYNRRARLAGLHIHGAGASGVAFVGDPDAVRNPVFQYGDPHDVSTVDPEPGPKNDNYPMACVLEDSLIHEIGLVEKQGAGVQIAMARRITVRDCSIYDTSRAGINIGDGTWGGHLIEGCDVFNTVLETSDHGSFNSWGRDRFWLPKSGQTEVIEAVRNIVMQAYRPIWMEDNWDAEIDHNWFTSSEADRVKFIQHGADANSVVGDPQFADPSTGDFTVQNAELAAAIGFENFPMDQFGVKKPSLRQIARTPVRPEVTIQAVSGQDSAASQGETTEWSGATLTEPQGEALSAYGASFEAGGVAVLRLKADSPLAGEGGLQRGDLIQEVGNQKIATLDDLKRTLKSAKGDVLEVSILRSQSPVKLQLKGWSRDF